MFFRGACIGFFGGAYKGFRAKGCLGFVVGSRVDGLQSACAA